MDSLELSEDGRYHLSEEKFDEFHGWLTNGKMLQKNQNRDNLNLFYKFKKVVVE